MSISPFGPDICRFSMWGTTSVDRLRQFVSEDGGKVGSGPRHAGKHCLHHARQAVLLQLSGCRGLAVGQHCLLPLLVSCSVLQGLGFEPCRTMVRDHGLLVAVGPHGAFHPPRHCHGAHLLAPDSSKRRPRATMTPYWHSGAPLLILSRRGPV